MHEVIRIISLASVAKQHGKISLLVHLEIFAPAESHN